MPMCSVYFWQCQYKFGRITKVPDKHPGEHPCINRFPSLQQPMQHIDLCMLHSGKSLGLGTFQTGSAVSCSNSCSSSHNESVAKNNRFHSLTRLLTLSNLSESNRELVLVLGLEAVYATGWHSMLQQGAYIYWAALGPVAMNQEKTRLITCSA
jgi:hypothetical protein